MYKITRKCIFGKCHKRDGFRLCRGFRVWITSTGGMEMGIDRLVMLLTGQESIQKSLSSNEIERLKGLEYAKEVAIYDHVWIGGNVTILPGVKINRGAIIGAGSVVVDDIPPYVIAAGNPCKVIRSITSDDVKKKW